MLKDAYHISMIVFAIYLYAGPIRHWLQDQNSDWKKDRNEQARLNYKK